MKKKGVPIGYQEHWSYRGRWDEKKVAPGTWKFRFQATKRRKSGSGGPGPGSELIWGFKNVTQRAIKRRSGQYETIMKGTKYLKKANIRKGR